MARISDEDIQRVRDANDVVEVISQSVVLKQKGGVFWGCCPFHGEKTPSFKVDPTLGTWYCFGCHKHGNVFDYVMETDSLTFREAVISLAEKSHIELHLDDSNAGAAGLTTRLRDLCDETSRFYESFLLGSPSDGSQAARSYLSARKLNIDVAKKWRMGYAPGHGLLIKHLSDKGFTPEEMVKANVAMRNSRGLVDRFFERIMFPIADTSGRIIAFGGRVVGKGEPKYLNSSDTPLFHKSRNLFGLDRAKAKILATKTALIVEGYTDVIALHEAGFENAVATLGTALTEQHLKLLSRFAQRIVYVFDGDEAGMRAANRAVEFIDKTITVESNSNPMVLDVVVLPDAKDPADVVGSEGGKELFNTCLEQAVPLIQFSIDRRLSQWDLARSEERQRALNDAASVLVPLRGTVMATDYVQYIVDRLWAHGVRVDTSAVLKALDAQVNKPINQRVAQEEEVIEPPSTQFNLPPEATADELLAQEALVWMIRDKEARITLAERLNSDDFCYGVYGEIFDAIKGPFKSYDTPVLTQELSEKFPGFDAVLTSQSVRFTDSEKIAAAIKEVAVRLKERSLELSIAQATKEMRQSNLEDAQKKELMIKITDAQKALLAMRSQRYN